MSPSNAKDIDESSIALKGNISIAIWAIGLHFLAFFVGHYITTDIYKNTNLLKQ